MNRRYTKLEDTTMNQTEVENEWKPACDPELGKGCVYICENSRELWHALYQGEGIQLPLRAIRTVCYFRLFAFLFTFQTPGGKRISLLLTVSGAIIGDGNHKSWDPRAPMIWDHFSFFWTNCATMTTYIRADPSTCHGYSRGSCLASWSNGENCEIFLSIFEAMAGNKNQSTYM